MTVENFGCILYIKGNENTDGSFRFNIVTFDSTVVTEIQERVDGIWQPSSFKTGPGSVIVGTLVSLRAAGSHLITTDNTGNTNFLPRSSVVDGVTTRLSTIINAVAFTVREVIRSDESTTFTGASIDNQVIGTASHLITGRFYFKTGATAATEPVRIEAWDGIGDTGAKIFDQTYPAASFPADVEIALDLDGFLEFALGADTFTRISSDADFSLKTNPAMDAWWLAIDFSEVKDDDLLQTIEYLDGDNFDLDQWTIQDRHIYVCNVTGVQTGGFNSNLDKWDTILTRHDRQSILVPAPVTTTSTTFVDVPGGELTTADLDGDGIYQFWLSMSVQQSNNNTSVTFRSILAGTPGEERTVQFGPNTANTPQHATLIGQGDDISSGTVIQLQWRVSAGTGQINSLRIMFDGVLATREVDA